MDSIERMRRNRGSKSFAVPHEALREQDFVQLEPVIQRRVDPERGCVVQHADGLGERAVDVELLDLRFR